MAMTNISAESRELIDHCGDVRDNRTWQPSFDWTVSYENDVWWDGVPHDVSGPWFVQVLQDGAEVARIELAVDVDVNPRYVNAPTLGHERLAIDFIEVAVAARGRGIGSRALQVLTERHPSNRFIA